MLLFQLFSISMATMPEQLVLISVSKQWSEAVSLLQGGHTQAQTTWYLPASLSGQASRGREPGIILEWTRREWDIYLVIMFVKVPLY